MKATNWLLGAVITIMLGLIAHEWRADVLWKAKIAKKVEEQQGVDTFHENWDRMRAETGRPPQHDREETASQLESRLRSEDNPFALFR